jgi:FixJ family two-component response regulator
MLPDQVGRPDRRARRGQQPWRAAGDIRRVPRPPDEELQHFAAAAIDSARAVVYIVDDDVAIQSGLGRVLRGAGYTVEPFSSPLAFLSRKLQYGPACLIINARLPEMSGIDVQNALLSAGDELPVIFLSAQPDTPNVVRAIQKGAIDFLVKPVVPEVLLDRVSLAVAQHRNRLKEMIGRRELMLRFARLTPREREVAVMVGNGLANKEIAARLGTAEKTIKHHRARAMTKLGVESVAQLVRMLDRIGVSAI